MFGRHKTDVLVVGAGPVGLMTALWLSNRGVRVEIVEAEWRPAERSYALGLHPQSLRLLDKLGLADELLREAHGVEAMAFYEGDSRRAEIGLMDSDPKFPFMAILPQSALEMALIRQLQHHGVKIHWSHRLARLERVGDRVRATVDKLEKYSTGYAVSRMEWCIEKTLRFDAAFVVGADGHRSIVRREANIQSEDFGVPELFAVFEFETDVQSPAQVRVVLDPESTNVVWPLGERRCRWSFQLLDPDPKLDPRIKSRLSVQVGAEVFPYLTEDLLGELLAERAPWFRGSIGEILWSTMVRFDRRLVTRFGHDQMWLAGDAAHLTGPIGMQSMNVGLREAYELASRIAEVLRGGSHDLLEEYGQNQRLEWQSLFGLTGGLQGRGTTDPWIRSRAKRILPCIPASGEELVRLADQLSLDLVPSESAVARS